MGEAKRRAAEIARIKELQAGWRSGLSEEEKAIVELAEKLDVRVVRGKQYSGGCYHLAFFMTRYLAQRGISVSPVVGWINDGQWNGMTSHAWIEYEGKKTDASLTYMEHDATPTGSLLVLDHVLRSGEVDYTYYHNDDPKVASAIQWMETVSQFAGPLKHKKAEHSRMLELASTGRIDEHLSQAPVGARYADLAAYIA